MDTARELARARATIARQAEEIECLRRLARELARRADYTSPLDLSRSARETSEPGAAAVEPVDDEPAWSWVTAFLPGILPTVEPIRPLDDLTPAWAWGGSSGRRVRVAVIDSGIQAEHPAVGGPISGFLAIEQTAEGLRFDRSPHGDDNGHGTACAGLIRALAPKCELYSVKVLGPDLVGSGAALVAALRWAIDNEMRVCNVSLGTTRPELQAPLRALADLAYFRGMVLVAAANNMAVSSFPSAFASALSVAAVRTDDPYRFYYNPRPPVEFGARGYDVRVATLDGGWSTESANSFAAPHLSGIVARIVGNHPRLTPFQVKTVLRALAANVSRPTC